MKKMNLLPLVSILSSLAFSVQAHASTTEQNINITVPNVVEEINKKDYSKTSNIYHDSVEINSTEEYMEFINHRYTKIEGYLSIDNVQGIEDFSGLTSLTQIIGGLIVNNTSISSFAGLENTHMFGVLAISGNDNLVNLDGLQQVRDVSDLIILSNPKLRTLEGLSIDNIATVAFIERNESLTDLKALKNVKGLHALRLTSLPSLTDLSDLSNLKLTSDYLSLVDLPQITNLDPLSNVSFVGDQLTIGINTMLADFCGLTQLMKKYPPRLWSVHMNLYNPTKSNMWHGNCAL